MQDIFKNRSSIRDFYEKDYINKFEEIDEPDLDLKFSMLKPFLDKTGLRGTVLDLGCGTGGMLKKISGAYRCKQIGSDISFKTLKSNYAREFHRFQSDAEFLPVKSGSINLIYYVDLIEHLPSPADFLKSLKSLNTDVLMFIPLEAALLNDLIFYYRRLRGKATNKELYGHIHRFNKVKVIKLLNKAGFINFDFKVELYDNFKKYTSLKGKILNFLSKATRNLSPCLHRHIFGGYAFIVLCKNK